MPKGKPALEGKIIGQIAERHGHQELASLSQEVPRRLPN